MTAADIATASVTETATETLITPHISQSFIYLEIQDRTIYSVWIHFSYLIIPEEREEKPFGLSLNQTQVLLLHKRPLKPLDHASSGIIMEEAINYLELVGSDRSVLLDVLPDLPQDGQHGHVRFSGTGGSAKQDVLVRVETDFGQLALNPVQLFEALKRALSVGRQRFNRDQLKRKGKKYYFMHK